MLSRVPMILFTLTLGANLAFSKTIEAEKCNPGWAGLYQGWYQIEGTRAEGEKAETFQLDLLAAIARDMKPVEGRVDTAPFVHEVRDSFDYKHFTEYRHVDGVQESSATNADHQTVKGRATHIRLCTVTETEDVLKQSVRCGSFCQLEVVPEKK